ncbi:hypothetical protein PPYR_08509 [Photinus pyralis]|uniref:C2H2-type domain-containing protein n=1 Tax=Photinus pyralis TaxID=7054 RepID=A0A5N4AJP3_PHOPY|nr:hypothetical protein PPYR_08509 [Photinus pyralis]
MAIVAVGEIGAVSGGTVAGGTPPCFYQPCPRKFNLYSGLRRHLRTYSTAPNTSTKNVTADDADGNANDVIHEVSSHSDNDVNFSETTDQLLNCSVPLPDPNLPVNEAANFVSKLTSLGLPATTTQQIIDATNEFVNNIVWSMHNNDQDGSYEPKNYFQNFDSHYKREKYFEAQIVKPIEICLGQRHDQIWDQKSFFLQLSKKPVIF